MKLNTGAMWGIFGIVYATSMMVVYEYHDGSSACEAAEAQYQAGLKAEHDYIKNLDDKYPAYKDNPAFGKIAAFHA